MTLSDSLSRSSTLCIDTPINSNRSKIAKINIQFNSNSSAARGKTSREVDTADAAHKIHIFLDQFLCHFTQNLTFEKENIQSLLDVLFMECSIIPPRCRGAYYNLIGYFYASLEKFEKAHKYFDMALKLNPEDVVAYVNKARAFLANSEILRIYPLIRRLTEIQSKSAHTPGSSPLSNAQNTIALAYNKLGLSCAALHYYEKSLQTDPFNFDNYLGRGEVLLKISKHQGRAHDLETLQDGISSLKKYIAEYNVLNLASEKDARESPLPRDNKAINNVFAVVLLARALNERSRKLGKDYTPDALEYLDLALTTDRSAFVLYQVGDEKRLMGQLEGMEGAMALLREAIDIRECYVIYHSYALALARHERCKYEERFRVASSVSGAPEADDSSCAENQDRKKSLKHNSSKSDKPKPFVFEGDDELKAGIIKVAKLLKHALKISHNGSKEISLDLAEIHCSLNRRSEAEAMFRNVMTSSNPSQRELAFRKFGRFLIKIGEWDKGDEMMEEALKLREQIVHDEVSLKQLEDCIVLLADHFSSENSGRGKFWQEQISSERLEESGKGLKSSRERRR